MEWLSGSRKVIWEHQFGTIYGLYYKSSQVKAILHELNTNIGDENHTVETLMECLQYISKLVETELDTINDNSVIGWGHALCDGKWTNEKQCIK